MVLAEQSARATCLPLASRGIPMIRLLAEEARPAFAAWEDKADKVLY